MKNIVIGKSFSGSPLKVEFVGNEKSSLKIFIISGQHGDEKYSQKAVSRLINYWNHSTKHPFFAAILKNANPDGYKAESRKNAQSIDLNRDHLLLQSQETQAVHSFIRKWQPKVVIDVHNYPSRRKHLLKKHLILYEDIFIDIPTHLAFIHPINSKKINEFFSHILFDLESKGLTCSRYVLFQKSGKIRHSTLDVQDARNSLALRNNLFSILLEGREPLKKEGIVGENRTITSQFHALCSMVDWIVQNKTIFDDDFHIPDKNELVPIAIHYKNSNDVIELQVKNSKTKKLSKKKFKNYSPEVEISKFIKLPSAYGVPNSLSALIELLKKQGFSSVNSPEKNRYQMYCVVPSKNKKFSNNNIKRKTVNAEISNYTIFPTHQLGGRFLAVLLEPQSNFSLSRFPKFNLKFSKFFEYPIIRI